VLIQGLQTNEGWRHLLLPVCVVVDAGSALCAAIIASSFGSGAVMPGIQQVHQLITLSLLRVTGHLSSLSMASALRAHLHRRHLHDDRLEMPGKQADHNTCR